MQSSTKVCEFGMGNSALYVKLAGVPFFIWYSAKGLRSRMPFSTNRIFPGKIREISRLEHSGTSSSQSCLSPAIWDWSIPVPSQSRKWNGKGILEFEILGKFRKNSLNSVLDGKSPVGYWNMFYKSRPNKSRFLT